MLSQYIDAHVFEKTKKNEDKYVFIKLKRDLCMVAPQTVFFLFDECTSDSRINQDDRYFTPTLHQNKLLDHYLLLFW